MKQVIPGGWPLFGQEVGLREDVHAFDRVPVVRSLRYAYTPDEVRGADVRDDWTTGVQPFEADIVMFVPEEKTRDGIFVITVHGEVFVKRLAFDPFHRQVTVISENERYSPTVIKKDEATG